VKKIKNKECSAMFVCAYLKEVESSSQKHMINKSVFSQGAKHAVNYFDRLWRKSTEELDTISIKEMLKGAGSSNAELKAVEQVKYIERFYKSLHSSLVELKIPVALNRANVFAIALATNKEHGALFDLTM
jgi:hypothetical protein